MSTPAVIDFHVHHVPARFTLNPPPPGQEERWRRIGALIQDRSALLADIEAGELAARVVNIPAALFLPPDEPPPPALLRELNDELAGLVAAHPGRLYGLASVDAFGGEAAAAEVGRAAALGLHGLFLDSARGDLLLDAAEARPVLREAARLRLPVFAHPVNPQPLTRRMARYGKLGTLFARGTANAASLVALLEGEVLEELPELRIVVTALALGGVLLSGAFGERSTLRADAPALLRRHVLVDTMGFDPVTIRAAVGLLGADHVVAGSDWPIIAEAAPGARALAALAEAGLDEAQVAAVAGATAQSLLDRPDPPGPWTTAS